MDPSAASRHCTARSESWRNRASRAPRSQATQHMTFDEVKCRGSPRISQIPWSGSRQCAIASSTWRRTMRQVDSGEASRDLVCR